MISYNSLLAITLFELVFVFLQELCFGYTPGQPLTLQSLFTIQI